MYNTGGKHRAGSKKSVWCVGKTSAGRFSVLRRFCAAVVRGRGAPGPFRRRRGVQLVADAPSTAPGLGRGGAAAP